MAITIHDLAQIAGLNASTISRALRDDKRFKPATRQRIQELALKYGYSPNLPARQLAQGKTGNIWCCLGSANTDIERYTAIQLNELFHQKELDLLLVLHCGSLERFRMQLGKLFQKVADGVLLIPPANTDQCLGLTELVNRLPVPHLFIDRYWDGTDCPVITTDNAQATRHLVDRCAEWGAKLFWVDFSSNNPVARTRSQAAIERIEELGIRWMRFDRAKIPAPSPLPVAIIGNTARQDITEFSGRTLFGAFFDFWENRTPGLYRKVIVCRQDFDRISVAASELMMQMLAGDTPQRTFIEIPPEKYLEF